MPSSYGFSVARERRRTTGPAELIAGLLLIAVVCWLVFPRGLVSQLRSARVDAVTLSYAGTWLRARPDDYAVRLLLADRLIDMGLADQARRQLDYIGAHTDDPRWRAPQRWLSARLLFARLMAVVPEKRDNNPLKARVWRAVDRIDAKTLDNAQLQQYADMALALDRLDLTVNAYHLLAARPPSSASWYQKAAVALLAHGRYQAAADEYVRALDASAGQADAGRYFLKALATLQSGNRLKQAMQLAVRRQGPFLADPEMLYRLMNLARAAGDTSRAEFYARRLLHLDTRTKPSPGSTNQSRGGAP